MSKLVLILVAFVSSNVFAGTQVVMKDIKNGKASDGSVVISVEGDFLRMDNSEKSDNSQVIFNRIKQEMLIIDSKEKTYTRLNKEMIDQINKKMNDMKKQLDAQMASMPKAQRDMMKSMMGDMLGGAGEKKKKVIKLKKTSRSDKAAGNSCKVTELFVDGKKTKEFCVAGEVKGSKEVLSAMKDMSGMFRKLYESMSESFPMMQEANPFDELDKLDGFPIIVTDFKKNKATNRTELVSIESKSFDKKYFMPPKKYKEQKIDLGE